MKKIDEINKISDVTREVLLTLAVAHLGGQKKKIYTEDIVMQVFTWNPTDYSWKLKKYKKFPDKYICFNQLHKARSMNLISGAMSADLHKDGWMLTNKGLELYNNLKHLFKNKPHASKLGIQEIYNLKKQIKQKKLYKSFIKEKKIEISPYELSEFLDCTPDNIKIIRRNFFKLYLKINSLEDNKIINFFQYLINYFPSILNEEEFQNDQKNITN